MKKNILIGILIVIILGLGCFIVYDKKKSNNQVIEGTVETPAESIEEKNKEVDFDLDDIFCALTSIRDVNNTEIMKILFAWDLAVHDDTITKMYEDDVEKYFQTEGATGDVIISTTVFFNKYKEVWQEEMTTTKFKSLLSSISSYTYPMQISDTGYILGSHVTGGYSDDEVKVKELSRNYITNDEMLIKVAVEYIEEYSDYTNDYTINYDITIKINDDESYSFISIEQK